MPSSWSWLPSSSVCCTHPISAPAGRGTLQSCSSPTEGSPGEALARTFVDERQPHGLSRPTGAARRGRRLSASVRSAGRNRRRPTDVLQTLPLPTREDLLSVALSPELSSLLAGPLVALRDLLTQVVERHRRGRLSPARFFGLLRHDTELLIALLEGCPQEGCESAAPKRWNLRLGLYSAGMFARRGDTMCGLGAHRQTRICGARVGDQAAGSPRSPRLSPQRCTNIPFVTPGGIGNPTPASSHATAAGARPAAQRLSLAQLEGVNMPQNTQPASK